MLTWRTTLLFLWPISAARKGHLEAPAWAEGGTGWPAGSWDSPFCLRATYGQNKYRTQNYTEYVSEPECFIWYNVATKLRLIKKNIFFCFDTLTFTGGHSVLSHGVGGGGGAEGPCHWWSHGLGCQLHHDGTSLSKPQQRIFGLLEKGLGHTSQERTATQQHVHIFQQREWLSGNMVKSWNLRNCLEKDTYLSHTLNSNRKKNVT